jgi:hypothetical protein
MSLRRLILKLFLTALTLEIVMPALPQRIYHSVAERKSGFSI